MNTDLVKPRRGQVLFGGIVVMLVMACFCVLITLPPRPHVRFGPAMGLEALFNTFTSLLGLALAGLIHSASLFWLAVETSSSKRPEVAALYGPWPRRAFWVWVLPLLPPAWMAASYLFTPAGAAVFFLLLVYLRWRRRARP